MILRRIFHGNHPILQRLHYFFCLFVQMTRHLMIPLRFIPPKKRFPIKMRFTLLEMSQTPLPAKFALSSLFCEIFFICLVFAEKEPLLRKLSHQIVCCTNKSSSHRLNKILILRLLPPLINAEVAVLSYFWRALILSSLYIFWCFKAATDRRMK